MNVALPVAACLVLLASGAMGAEAPAASPHETNSKPEPGATAEVNRGVLFTPEAVSSEGSVTVEGQRVDYSAVAGTIVVHPKGWDDAAAREPPELSGKQPDDDEEDKNPKAEASMFFVAYFKKGAPSTDRPIMFLYNGGPGSASAYLHMGAFGPRRVVIGDASHTPAAPYRMVDNAYSLLDVSDLVFIDAPGTGFSRIAGKDKEKAFFGVDPDANAFSQFIIGFLNQYGRWNSPKYLFGESYGTLRSAVVINQLETGQNVDFNGVVMLSQVLNEDLGADNPELNPGTDEAYVTALPSYAATAWYHNRLAGQRPANLEAFLTEVEQFAVGEYASALQAGSELDPARRQAIAERIAQYTGLPTAYILKADLRINGGEFAKTLQDPAGLTIGRFDSRYLGPTIDPLSKEADYDPQDAGTSSAFVSAFNDYARKQLGFGQDRIFKPGIEVDDYWTFDHQPPGQSSPARGIANAMPDLAYAMKYNPNLKIMLNGGYFDLATPFFAGMYEMHHLPVPASLQANIEFHFYQTGHMVYANEASLKALHDNVADFVRRTDNLAR